MLAHSLASNDWSVDIFKSLFSFSFSPLRVQKMVTWLFLSAILTLNESRWFIHQHGVEKSRQFYIVLLPQDFFFFNSTPHPQLIIQPSAREKSHSRTLASSSSSYTPGFKIRKMFFLHLDAALCRNCCQLMQKILWGGMRLMFEIPVYSLWLCAYIMEDSAHVAA